MLSNQYLKIIVIPFLFLNVFCFGTKYYVRNGGNDANSGLNDDNAWAHHPWMTTWTGKTTLVPGDIVYMKRGNTWTINNPQNPFLTVRNSGNSGNYIMTTAYGSGDKPLIRINTATDEPVVFLSAKSYLIFDNLHIQHHSGIYVSNSARSGFHLTNVCHHVIFTNNEIDHCPYIGIVAFGDSYSIIVGDTLALSTATQTSYSNHIHDFGYSGIGLQGTDPSTKISRFYVCNNYIHDATRVGPGNNEYGIYFSASVNSTSWPRYAVARFNRIENIKTWEAIDIHGGEYVNISDNYIKNFGTCGVHIAAVQLGNITPQLSHISVDRNIVEQPESGWIAGHENSFIVHFNSLDNFISRDINIRQNKCFYSNRPAEGKFDGIRFGNVDGINIIGNQIYNGALTSGKSGLNFSHNYGNYGIRNALIKGNYIDKWGPGIGITGSSLTGQVKIVYNVITKSEANGCIKINNDDIPSTGSVLLSNNVLIQGNYARCFQSFGGIKSGGYFEAKNNIIGWFQQSDGYYWQWLKTIEGTFTCDNNLYWNGTDLLSNFINQNFSNQEWMAAGYDNNSLFDVNPLFKNFSSNYSEDLDFYISSTSPTIDAGSETAYDEDYVGTKPIEKTDIGAFERQGNNDFPVPFFSEAYINDSFPAKVRIMITDALAETVPPVSSFKMIINGKQRQISKIEIAGNSVLIVLASRAYFGDVIQVSYIKPFLNPLSNSYGANVSAFNRENVSNDLTKINIPPVVLINADTLCFSGITGELDASESYDNDQDTLTYNWICNEDISLSSNNKSKIQFLVPMSSESKILKFTLTISDGRDNQSRSINVTSLPFKPELRKAAISSVDASDFDSINYPLNSIDGKTDTYWSKQGNNQWLAIKLQMPFKINYIVLSFNKDYKRSSWFDLYASFDSIIWEPLLSSVISCDFSSDLQIFQVASELSERQFRYLKFVGHGTEDDELNYIGEFMIYGTPVITPIQSNPTPKILANYRSNMLFITTEEDNPELEIEVFDMVGKLLLKNTINHSTEVYPLILSPGAYIIQIRDKIFQVHTSKFILSE